MKPSQIRDVEIDEDIAYLIGVLHSDGCIYRFFDKKKKSRTYTIKS